MHSHHCFTDSNAHTTPHCGPHARTITVPNRSAISCTNTAPDCGPHTDNNSSAYNSSAYNDHHQLGCRREVASPG